MREKRKKNSAKRQRRPPTPIVAIFRQGFQREIFRDLQDFLYEKFERPSLVVIPLASGGLYSCFPRRKEPLPDELFHHLVSLPASTRKRAPIEKFELERASQLLSREQAGESVSWGWHESPVGLMDLYVPVHLQGKTVAVLVFGKFLSPSAKDLSPLQRWVTEIVDSSSAKLSSGCMQELIAKIPSVDGKAKSAIRMDVERLVSLAERFFDRTVNTGPLFRDEELLGQLGLERPELNIGLDELWQSVQRAFEKITRVLPVKSAVAFSAKYRDINSLKRKALVPATLEIAETLPLASLEELEWLQGESWVNVPCEGDYLSWLNPHSLLASEHGVLFGRELIGGHVAVLAFGLGKERLTPWQRAALYDAVTSRIFSFIDRALFGIELDHLMAETGHLMGRAVAKVALGVSTLQELLYTEPAKQDPEIYRAALWAIEDGKTRLELIQQNFYAFQTRRKWREEQELAVEFLASMEAFDAIEALNSMRSYFDRAVAEADRKEIVYNVQEAVAVVLGDRNAFRLTLLNLFDNAMKFSYAKTFFTIEASVMGDVCSIIFRSLGVGVAKNEAVNIFQPFSKSRYKDPQRRIEGLGLGLSYCRWVVEEIFGGKISLASSEVNMPVRKKFQGDNWLTSVTMELPLQRAKDE
jgi:signal transduction histidine kinase